MKRSGPIARRESESHGVSIGSTLWLFDETRRVYPKSNRLTGSPIYAEHFIAFTVVGENRLSWILLRGGLPGLRHKATKKTLTCSTRWGVERYYTDQQKADAIWLEENRAGLAEAVRDCRDVETLKAIKALLDGAR